MPRQIGDITLLGNGVIILAYVQLARRYFSVDEVLFNEINTNGNFLKHDRFQWVFNNFKQARNLADCTLFW